MKKDIRLHKMSQESSERKLPTGEQPGIQKCPPPAEEADRYKAVQYCRGQSYSVKVVQATSTPFYICHTFYIQ